MFWIPVLLVTNLLPFDEVYKAAAPLLGWEDDEDSGYVATPDDPGLYKGIPELNVMLYDQSFYRAFFFMSLIAAILGTAVLSPSRSYLEILALIVGFGLPRQRKNWGVIYDAVTKRKIAFATLRLVDEAGKILAQTTADLDGNYRFTKPEKYKKLFIDLIAPGYEEIKVPVNSERLFSESVIVEDIAISTTKLELSKRQKLWHQIKPDLYDFLVGFIYLLSITWLVRTIYTMWIYDGGGPESWTYFTIYGISVSWNTFVIWERSRSVNKRIMDRSTRKPLESASVEVFSGDRKVEMVLTDFAGHVNFNVPPGQYELRIYKDGYQDQKELYHVKVTKDGYLSEDIYLEPLSGAQSESKMTLNNPFS